MRPTLLRLANASGPLPLSVSQASVQLIPPIPLYRRLLRAHRLLPVDMRYMGDSYVKSEFRLTRTTDNPLHIIGFLSQWKIYLDEIESSLIRPDGRKQGQAVEWRGKKLDTDAFEKLSTEQVGQLYELMHATKDVWKSPEQIEQEASSAGVSPANPDDPTTAGNS
ncbi:acetate non-utilizing protein 9, mitochondrial [Cryptococcus neoformans]|uniref:Succinate dehydrogenase assembly factor 3 n=2 Tax=Cryptococcus neoformans TaxID=5207 RepID=A0A854QKI1_CRYNE|nr:acetate non-utilizing protein 9, mitochondrial [Cryptococcus neoformans var. grubii H99]AUB22965.1 acetate non-utilizing protein 9, mitochondrial [Cryptococcus neoformans var. grubii]OWT41351.1 acetate non-utilizing protein 9, mitochondrial [Cryptococcus neoformans var. grubii Bt1]OWZ34814.1 acetate non-utilizing protein 9, mitochondrial [Cryptococcus neoformans var. grubii AD2-60a]OWZ46913.1 acetate non-utilizing protein 9, mitochondrial [Cryptococcus neoformans var. grubii C23]OWZ50703.1 |eukprot:XP_012047551.1 acetate non-utilizing protein 9, mitochondrial [Cryptococcus neoformans var. grubii H99]